MIGSPAEGSPTSGGSPRNFWKEAIGQEHCVIDIPSHRNSHSCPQTAQALIFWKRGFLSFGQATLLVVNGFPADSVPFQVGIHISEPQFLHL